MIPDDIIPFATVEDLEARWRALSDNERIRADVLLADATDLIVSKCPRWESATPRTRKRVVCAVVRRAMQGGDAIGGVTDSGGGIYSEPHGIIASESHTTGPFSDQFTYQNPEGGLYLKREEKDALGGSGGAFEVDLLQDYDVRSVTDQLIDDINAISGQEP